MARSTDPVIAYIEMLYANRDLISQAYHNAGVRETAENAKGVRALELARALRCFEGDLFRLTGKLRDHLDTVTSKLRAYDRLTRVSPQLERLRFLTTAMVEARHSGERQDMEQMAGDFADECFSIHDNVHANILKLSAQVQSGFATAQSVDEKIRQNQFYLRETAAIQDDLGSLVAFGLPADWQREELYEFARMYSAAVTEFLVGWQVQLAEIWKTIKAMLFKTRQVQVQNSNLARVLYLFQLHPRYEGPEIPVDDTSPAWVLKIEPLPLTAHPNVLSGATSEDLGAIAMSLPARGDSMVTPEDFEPQALIADEVDYTGSVVLEPDLFDAGLAQLLADASTCQEPDGVSAYEWKATRPDLDEIQMRIWLQCLLIEAENHDIDNLAIEPVFEEPENGLAATRNFIDVRMRRISAAFPQVDRLGR